MLIERPADLNVLGQCAAALLKRSPVQLGVELFIQQVKRLVAARAWHRNFDDTTLIVVVLQADYEFWRIKLIFHEIFYFFPKLEKVWNE
jgi:hypothetical protein